ncbi:MAG: hypothetical protein HQK60_08795 [Deltaproteobacteria bacterium]|nr:hypothetical protein [Deltaproteobacteria bacterium]
MKIISDSWDSVSEAGRYTCATMEYAGLLSFNLVKRGGRATLGQLTRATRPVATTLVQPFVFIKEKAKRVVGRKGHHEERLEQVEERLNIDEDRWESLEERLARVEERMSLLEKRGSVPTKQLPVALKERKLDDRRRGVLRAIMESNKLLWEQVG